MPKPEHYARIAITLPAKDLAAADRLALTHDRSRSWIVAEAIRRYAAADDEPSGGVSTAAVEGAAEEVATGDYRRRGLGPSRLAQLVRDLALTPEGRVRAAEDTLRLTELREKPKAHCVTAFDRYEDFLDWKRWRGVHR